MDPALYKIRYELLSAGTRYRAGIAELIGIVLYLCTLVSDVEFGKYQVRRKSSEAVTLSHRLTIRFNPHHSGAWLESSAR